MLGGPLDLFRPWPHAAVGPEAGRHAAEAALAAPFGHPSLPRRSPRATRPLVFCWRAPAFDPSATWTAFETSGRPHVRRIARLPSCDGRLRLYGAEAPLTETDWRDLRAGLAAATRDLALETPDAPPGLGLDGMSLGLRLFGGFGVELRLVWWQQPPDRWAPARDWLDGALRRFEAALPAPTAPIQRGHPWTL